MVVGGKSKLVLEVVVDVDVESPKEKTPELLLTVPVGVTVLVILPQMLLCEPVPYAGGPVTGGELLAVTVVIWVLADETEDVLEEEPEQAALAMTENWVESVRIVSHGAPQDLYALRLTLELARAINNNQHAIAGVGGLSAWRQVAWDFPVKGLLRCRDPFRDGTGLEHTVGAWSVAKHEADRDTLCRVACWVPGHGEVLALSDGLRSH